LRRKLAEMLDKQDNTPASLDELIQVARVRVERGQFEKASQALDEILDRDPENYAARRLRAEIFAKMGDQQRALQEFMKLTPGATPSLEDLTAMAHLAEGEGLPAEPLQVVPDFTFDNFVVGENSTFAHAMALAVAKAPAMHYNPLFVYSDVGLGKTHLISAIANYIAQHQPDLRVIYTSAEEFTVQLVQAIQNNTSIALRNQYKAAGVLLMDDIQFLAGKERAQEEFFHIFNALFQAKRQIVVTSDRPPKDIARLEKRLKSRFGSGVIVDIQLPDLETRAAILKKDLEHHASVPMDNRLIHLIAERITTNVRELKGALNQILVKHELTGEELNEAFVLKVLEIYGEKS
jgi:chromosomal replication initiator protein